jgi:hypothetical protein
MDEMSNILVSVDLILIIWDWCIFWLVLVNPCLPDLIISLDFILKLFEEHGVLICKLVLGKSLQVQPCYLLHPWEYLVGVVNTSTHFKEEANITLVEFAILNENLGAHHQFKCNLVTLKETSVDVPIHFVGKALSDIVDSVFDEVGFWRVINTIIEEIKELLKRSIVHPVDICHLYNTEV